MSKAKRTIAVIDTETDPFMFDRVPKPFVIEFYTDKETQIFWGDDCIDQFCEWLERRPDPFLIYAHNGGKFDYHFFHKYLDNPAIIIKNRIVEAKLFHHTIRDSYAIIPVPLGTFDKLKFDYNKMEREVRDKHKEEILTYLHRDCTELYKLVCHFIDRFGPRLTIGGTAIREIQKLHPFRMQGSNHDQTFRPFYFGGRVQCFGQGIYNDGRKLVDRNSMYPSVMRDRFHPINGRFDYLEYLPDSFDIPFFAKITAKNNGALPSRKENGGLTFEKKHGIFMACSHEIEIALKYDLIEIEKVYYCFLATDYVKFDTFVDKFGEEKVIAKETGDKAAETFAKLIMNSGYGRAGLNPENFRDYIIFRDFGEDQNLIDQGYSMCVDYDDFELWEKKPEIKEEDFCDVAIAASITSAARANLLENLQFAIDPIYCDTDSIICKDFHGDLHPSRIGAWAIEKESKNVVIAGKKMYALYNDIEDGPLKISSKGGTVTLKEMIRMSNGETIIYHNPAPTFSLKRETRFQTRSFKSTLDRD